MRETRGTGRTGDQEGDGNVLENLLADPNVCEVEAGHGTGSRKARDRRRPGRGRGEREREYE